MKIAVVGSGIAGLAAARVLLHAPGAPEVALFEAADRPGGHVYTVDVGGTAIDMGFIVCNRERYPRFFAMLGELGIETRPTHMAFSVALPDDGSGAPLEWSSASLSGLFAQRRRLFDRRHWRFLVEVLRFLRRARADLASGALPPSLSLDEYLARIAASADLRERFIVPLAAALWSLAPARCGAFPAETYVAFLDQHGMLTPVRPFAWRTVVGGSRRYVDALLAELRGTGRFALHLASPIGSIARDARGVTVTVAGREHRFARAIVATHADTALALLAAPTPDEQRLLGAFRYSANRTVLHTDERFLPQTRAAHASWNYVADPDAHQVAVTYSMTRLQGLPPRTDGAPYLVTLNPRTQPRGALHEAAFAHPQFDAPALAAQRAIPRLSGTRTYFAGAYLGFGFHEDGMRAGHDAAARALADEATGK